MKYYCKYPGKLDKVGYYYNLMREYKDDPRFSLSEKEFSCLLSCVLKDIRFLIEHPENNLRETLDFLLKLISISKDQLEVMPSNNIKPDYIYYDLLGIFCDPKGSLELIENHYKTLKLKKELEEQYVDFLQEVARRCIKDIVTVNQVKLNKPIKHVGFADTEILDPLADSGTKKKLEQQFQRRTINNLEEKISVCINIPHANQITFTESSNLKLENEQSLALINSTLIFSSVNNRAPLGFKRHRSTELGEENIQGRDKSQLLLK